MKIGEVAKLSGVSTRTIDYYTNSGLLAFERSDTNYRLYPTNVLQTLERIQVLKKQRMSIAEIQEIICAGGTPETEELVDEVIDEFNRLQQKIVRLEEQLKDAPAHAKAHASKALATQMAAITALLALLQ
ncbi:MerR family transcriptional regulator [Planococcus salinarum]|uniref:MerR family transcriptional regulator n=1 Tax=Planococcus salinarum TaxID=622695 RepID=UPI000E3C0A17|nr:MerR family transcriptional regulator [Planococcus salinarum]TAA69213.1 MerR family transcriptional regulator [Planococcus salinarum]